MSRRRPPLRLELLGLVLLVLFAVAAGLHSTARAAAATRSGRRIFAIEQFPHIDGEPALIRAVATYGYASTYLIAAAALLIWVYVRRPEQYRTVRGSFVALNVLAVAVFLVYPPFAGSTPFAWALWASVLLVRVTRRRWLQIAGALHAAGVLVVLLATADQYLLVAVGDAVVVLLATRRARPGTVPAADAFFLHVESPVAAQHVGGLAVLANGEGRFSQDALRRTVQAHLPDLPRFRQKLCEGTGWRRPRWIDVPPRELDWAWHVPHHDLTRPDGTPGDDAALDALVAALAAEPLPHDRPLWRFVAVTGVEGDRAAAILLVHHVIADGIGTVAQAMEMLEPHIDLPLPPPGRGPGLARRAFGTAVGLAQLAMDGRPSFTLPTGATRTRTFTTVDLPLPEVREVAHRQHTRVSDVLLTTVAGALRRAGAVDNGHPRGAHHHTGPRDAGSPDAGSPDAGPPDAAPPRAAPPDAGSVGAAHHRSGSPGVRRGGLRRGGALGRPLLRVAVPLMVRAPGTAAEGNLTAAVMTDLPLGPLAEEQRLTEIARRSRSLYTGTRMLASNFVMRRVGALMPVPLHAWFARTVYGGRFFQAIVSNMPGPSGQLSLAGGRLVGVYPILPLAPRAPLAIGALGWDGVLSIGVAADPALAPDIAAFGAAMSEVFAELLAATELGTPPLPGSSLPGSPVSGSGAIGAEAPRIPGPRAGQSMLPADPGHASPSGPAAG